MLIIALLAGLKSYAADLGDADSLFAARKYTQSFDIYDSLLSSGHQSSPAMLLKMAYIKEGLGNPTQALYYLNLYYLRTADRKVLNKMEELAEEKNFAGYEFNDFEFVQTVFYKYYFTIVFSLLALAVLMLAVVFRLRQRQMNAAVPAFLMVLTLAVVFYILNYGREYDRSIVTHRETFVMSGPSAAAEVLEVVSRGTRLHTYGHEDVWVKVKVNDREGYIRQTKLREISL